ncbi:hypothetical protein DER45DRAFT_580551 [Fusarium avenaceum]|nr:hypothetical protein DER45DRAFT_580551 [Fusarium avenaceum]
MSSSTCGRPASIPLSSALAYTFLTMKGNFAYFFSACHKLRAVTVAKTLKSSLWSLALISSIAGFGAAGILLTSLPDLSSLG